MPWYLIWFAFTKNHNLWINILYYHQFTPSEDKMLQNSILARIFGFCQRLWQGLKGILTSGKEYKDKSCPCKEIWGTRIRFHPWADCSFFHLVVFIWCFGFHFDVHEILTFLNQENWGQIANNFFSMRGDYCWHWIKQKIQKVIFFA